MFGVIDCSKSSSVGFAVDGAGDESDAVRLLELNKCSNVEAVVESFDKALEDELERCGRVCDVDKPACGVPSGDATVET
jgi:hypothetical protein